MFYKNTIKNKLIKNKKNECVKRAMLKMRATQNFNREALHTFTSMKETNNPSLMKKLTGR